MSCRLGIATGVAALMILGAVHARAADPQDGMEKRVLVGPDFAKQWSAAESKVEAADAPGRGGQRALHWHITVDHFAGEPNYPIGWPRISLALREGARDWSGWDYLQMSIYTDTSREALPREPVGLAIQAPDKRSAWNRPLDELAKGKWAQVRIPLSQVPRHSDVRQIQLHISESKYKHQDQLDFYIDEIALLRYARPTLLDVAAESAVMFADAKQLAVRFNLVGVKADEAKEVTCELRRGGKAVAKISAKAARGTQRVAFDLPAKLAAGDYEVMASVGGGAEGAPIQVRLVESPWQTAE